MVEAPIKLFNCPIPFKTDFEVGLNWGELVEWSELDGAEGFPQWYQSKEEERINMYKEAGIKW